MSLCLHLKNNMVIKKIFVLGILSLLLIFIATFSINAGIGDLISKGLKEIVKDGSATIESGDSGNVGKYFNGLEDRVIIEVLEDSANVEVMQEDEKTVIKGKGFTIKFLDKEGDIERSYKVQQGEFENILKFDKENQLTEGSNFKSMGGEEKDGKKQGIEILIKGYKVKLYEGDLINIQNEVVEISTNTAIKRPEKVDLEKKETEFKFKSEQEIEIEGEDIKFKGTLRAQGDKFYWQKGDELMYDKMDFVEDETYHAQGEKTFIGNKIEEVSKVPEGFDSAVIVDKQNKKLIVVGMGKATPVLELKQGNSFSKLDAETDHFAIQGFANSKITILEREEEGFISKVETVGQFAINEDYKSIYMNDNGKIFFRKNGVILKKVGGVEKTTTVPIELIPYNDKGELISKKNENAKLLISNFNQYATANLNKDFSWMKDYVYDGTDIHKLLSSRFSYNYYMDKEDRKVLATFKEDEIKKLTIDEFWAKNNPEKREYLEKEFPEKIKKFESLPIPIPEPEEKPKPEIKKINRDEMLQILKKTPFTPPKNAPFLLKFLTNGKSIYEAMNLAKKINPEYAQVINSHLQINPQTGKVISTTSDEEFISEFRKSATKEMAKEIKKANQGRGVSRQAVEITFRENKEEFKKNHNQYGLIDKYGHLFEPSPEEAGKMIDNAMKLNNLNPNGTPMK